MLHSPVISLDLLGGREGWRVGITATYSEIKPFPKWILLKCDLSRMLENLAVWNHVTEIILLHKLNSSPVRSAERMQSWQSYVCGHLAYPSPWRGVGGSVKSHRCHQCHISIKEPSICWGWVFSSARKRGLPIHPAPNTPYTFLCARHATQGTPQNVTAGFFTRLRTD